MNTQVFKNVSKDAVQSGARIIQEGIKESLGKKLPLQTAISLSAKLMGLKNAHHAGNSMSGAGAWLVVGRYIDSDMFFVDEITDNLVKTGRDAILSSSRSRYPGDDDSDEAPVYQVAIHLGTGERCFACADNQTEVSALDLVSEYPPIKRSVVNEGAVQMQEAFLTLALEEYDALVSPEALADAMSMGEDKAGRKLGAGVLAELIVEFVNTTTAFRALQCGTGSAHFEDLIDVDELSNAIRAADGNSHLSKMVLAQVIMGWIRKKLIEKGVA